jgi:hypothetical protein
MHRTNQLSTSEKKTSIEFNVYLLLNIELKMRLQEKFTNTLIKKYTTKIIKKMI